VTTPFTVGGIGTALPRRVVTNDDFAQYLDTSDEWITSRTGIRERRIVGPDESTRTLATEAARAALRAADLSPEQLDTIIVATATPEHQMPSTASEVASDLTAQAGSAVRVTAGAFDLNAACAGFVYALTVAGSLLGTGVARNILLIGADAMSRIVDQQDRSAAVLFGDGAAALVLQQPVATTGAQGTHGGLIACDLVDHPEGVHLLVVPGGGSADPPTIDMVANRRQFLRMDGSDLFRRAVRGVAESIHRTLRRAGVTAADVDVFIPHQANARIIDAVLPRVGIDPGRAIQTVDHHGNTSAASVPLAMAEATASGRLTDGSLVLTSGFGAGLTIGTALLRWQTI
jgi:3-oxoacyl-[acyl-carrier-protein] synthase-3